MKKKSLEEKISSLLQKQNDWLEPMQEWIKEAQNIGGIARDTDLFAKKVCAKEIFGSNLLLQNKSVRASAPNFLNSPAKQTQTAWASLCDAHSLVSSKPIGSVLVPREGLEPSRHFSHTYLKRTCMPFHHRGRVYLTSYKSPAQSRLRL